MRFLRLLPRWLFATCFVAASLTLIAWSWPVWRGADSVAPPHIYNLQAGRMEEWKPLGGDWRIVDGVMYNNSLERGAKLLTGSTAWRDYTVKADIRFEGDNADMGVIVRSNDEERGTDTYNGYYVGIRTTDGSIRTRDGSLVIGRSKFGWAEADPVPVPGGIQSSVWYRLRVTAVGCDIAASVQNLSTLQTAWIAFTEPSCLKAGRIGLRSNNAVGMWRNIGIDKADLNDYLQLRRHAASVENPEVLPSPPWWTPWHAGMVFGGILAISLLMQLCYFRIQQWKAYTITHERERLAHNIHDTMAQSFAGIGYQIQGIRHSLVAGKPVNSSDIADQLNVAYQLVRRCHEEASRTIAMLGSPAEPMQQNLLGALEETAKQIARDDIQVLVESSGTALPLDLRLADALLHIGREALVNALSHAGPTVLKVRLNYAGRIVRLEVEDNGRGFESTAETAGFGILGMQKRARDIGGVMQILSTAGQGTLVRVTAKLQRERTFRRILARAKFGLGSAAFNMHPR